MGGKVVLDDAPSEVFKNIELIEQIGLDIPLPTRLLYELNLPTEGVLTSKDCVEVLCQQLNLKM